MKLTVTLVQLSAGPDKRRNLDHACELVSRAAEAGASFVLLPEVFGFVADASHWHDAAERGIHLLAGSLLEDVGVAGKCANTSILIGPDGAILACYRKMHLFRVTLPDGVVFDETDYTEPGRAPVTVETAFGRVGMTICYDLRFPELYRSLTLSGAGIVTVPSAFTAFTGEAHWRVLLRARAVENQVFVLAPNQVGTSSTGVSFYGHSLIVDPWGAVLAEGGDDEELVSAEIDTDRVDEVRTRLVALEHVRRELLGRDADTPERRR